MNTPDASSLRNSPTPGLTNFLEIGRLENYGSRGSFISRATRRRSRFAREGATKIHHVRATEASNAMTPSSNCQPIPITPFSTRRNCAGRTDATRAAGAKQGSSRRGFDMHQMGPSRNL